VRSRKNLDFEKLECSCGFLSEDYVFFISGASFGEGDATVNWIRIASMGVPLIFNKFDIYDFLQGLSIGLGLVACFEIIAALVAAWQAKRRSGPGG
jgi:hypothetical protein